MSNEIENKWLECNDDGLVDKFRSDKKCISTRNMPEYIDLLKEAELDEVFIQTFSGDIIERQVE